MDYSNNLEVKYQKLASEYSKLRAQASVLKKAVIDEQNKNTTLREQLRERETSFRRAEQEVDSLGFRNKQLEHRVASLQEDIKNELKKSNKNQKINTKLKNTQPYSNNDLLNSSLLNSPNDPLIFEELQKKIMENAQLISLVDDKERDIQFYSIRIKELEKQVDKNISDNTDIEKRLRRELDTLINKNTELETKLVEVTSMIGSEDAFSVSGSEITPLNNHTNSSTGSDERIAVLEKEILHWRTQFEMIKTTENAVEKNIDLNKSLPSPNEEKFGNNCCSSAAVGIVVNSFDLNSSESKEPQSAKPTKDELLFNCFSKKFENLLKDKCVCESRLNSYINECEHLQNCLEIARQEVLEKDCELQISSRSIQALDDDLAITRLNYEEQITVLTEQVISLSEQLASK